MYDCVGFSQIWSQIGNFFNAKNHNVQVYVHNVLIPQIIKDT